MISRQYGSTRGVAGWRLKCRPSEHFIHFVQSRHTTDLVVITGFFIAIAFGVIVPWPGKTQSSELVAAALAAAAAAIGWAYQTGNVRLGVADLFGCEILTLCRISAMSNFVQELVDRFALAGTASSVANVRGVGQENYLVIFDSTARDLEALDGRVVETVTSAYVYVKALRDRLRMLSELTDNADTITPGDTLTYRQRLIFETIYTAFLTFESAREALVALLDRPTVSNEAVLTALLSELVAYRFLIDNFSHLRGKVPLHRVSDRYRGYIVLMDDIMLGKPPAAYGGRALVEEAHNIWRHIPEPPNSGT